MLQIKHLIISVPLNKIEMLVKTHFFNQSRCWERKLGIKRGLNIKVEGRILKILAVAGKHGKILICSD